MITASPHIEVGDSKMFGMPICSEHLWYFFVVGRKRSLQFANIVTLSLGSQVNLGTRYFSAIQILLSSNTDNYVEPEYLFIRFFIAHIGIVAMIAFWIFHFECSKIFSKNTQAQFFKQSNSQC